MYKVVRKRDTIRIPAEYIRKGKSLNEHIDRLLINYELMDLLAYCEEAIGGDNTVQIDSSMSTYI